MPDYSHLSVYRYPNDLCASAAGSYITLTNGEHIFDACCGLTGAALGYYFPSVINAIKEQIDSGAITLPGYIASKSQGEALRSIISISPKYISKAHIKGCSGGSTAIEQAIKHALADRDGDHLLTLDVGHFGQTIATNISAGDSRESDIISRTYSAKIITINTSDCMTCPLGLNSNNCEAECLSKEFERLDYLYDHHKLRIAAFLFEPVSGASGCLSWPSQFWHSIKSWCQKKEIFLIADESQTFGRLGEFFAVEKIGINVDAICLAKGISGIGVPGCGALLLANSSIEINKYQRSLTWAGSPLSCAAIHATVNEMSTEGFFLLSSTCATELSEALKQIVLCNQDIFSGVRGTGLMLGLKLRANIIKTNISERIISEARRFHLYLRLCPLGQGDVIEIRPRLNITHDEVIELVEKLIYTIDSIKNSG